jgi:hypothetical protein
MAQYIDFTTFEGSFKTIFEDGLVRVVPAFTDCQQTIKFNDKRRQGEEIRVSLALQLEAGMTWAQQDGSAFDLELPIAGVTKFAKVKGSCGCLRSAVAYVAAFAGEDPAQAVENTTGSTVKNAYEAMRKFLEADILYGQDDEGIGVVLDIEGQPQDPSGTIATDSVQITLASWAPGLWVEGAKVEFYSPDHTDLRNDTFATIESVDLDTRVVTFDDLPAAVAAGDVIHYKTQFSEEGGDHNTMAGLKKILSTTSGTLFNIDVGVYNKWRGNVYDVNNGPLTFPKLGRAMARIAAKGGQGNRFIAWLPLDSWVDINSDIDALRTDDTSGYKPGMVEVGHERITYHSVAGPVELRAHAMVKASEAFVIPEKGFERLGSTDITFDRSKMTGLTKSGPGNFLLELSNNAGFEFRGFHHQAIFTERPGFCVFFKNILQNTVA